jgi:hypothetical protein
MAIKLSTPASVQAFLMGYGQKEARIPAIWNTIKAIVGGGKKLVDSGAKGVVKGWEYTDKNPYLSIGAPIVGGTGLGVHGYIKDENPDKLVLPHIARGAGLGLTGSTKYWKTLFGKVKPGRPRDFAVPVLKGTATSVVAERTPAIIDAGRQTKKVLDQVDKATMHAQEGTGNIGTMVERLQNETIPKIEAALDQLSGDMGIDAIAAEAFKKKLPIIVGALAVTGVGAYALHKYIGYRLAKAVEKVPKDEAAAAASALARRLRGDEYGTEELEEESEADALKAEAMKVYNEAQSSGKAVIRKS